MIETIGVAEAKRRFSELIDRVRRGERFIIARRGKPAVALLPPEQIPPEERKPLGLLSLVGLLSDWGDDEVDAMVKDIYRARRRSKDRPAPRLD